MAGFMKFSIIAEHYGNKIVNVLHYRSEEWLPWQGNPFDDTLAAVDAVWTHLSTVWRAAHNQDTRILRVEGVGYDDAYATVTAAPLVRTVDLAGTSSELECSGSYQSATIGLQCGHQEQINGVGTSKRNRGYLSIGPIPEAAIDSYGHITSGWHGLLNNVGDYVSDSITIVAPAVTLIPIRIHEKWTRLPSPMPDVLMFRTYSDVLGYTIPRKASVRRSRMGEA